VAKRVGKLRTAAETEDQRRLAAQEAENDRCGGTGVLQLVVKLSVGTQLDAKKLRGCKYSVGAGKVLTTTRDGWTIVAWGSNLAAAFRTRKARVDGSLFRSTGTATYLGIRQFDRTDSGTSTVATFKLDE